MSLNLSMIARRAIPLSILALALALRVVSLDEKPAHFDEGVNGSFVDAIGRQGYYHYDPSNFHGPLHFYVLFLAQTLLGRDEWVLRLPTALVSTACVAMLLAFRRSLPERACWIAALAMAVSPGMIFYGRYAIHETWLLFFLLLVAWGVAELWQSGRTVALWALGLGAAGMISTKETYAIHFAAILLTMPAISTWERWWPSLPNRIATQQWDGADLTYVAAAAAGVIVFFYSGALLDWSSLPGLWQTFGIWFATGTGGQSGHEKEWHYWLQLLGRYEWPTLIGLLSCAWLLLSQTDRFARGVAIYGLGALTAYTLIAYKTPWCSIVLMWPFLIVFGLAMDRAMAAFDPWVTGVAAGIVCTSSLTISLRLNFREFTNEEEPYVYVQTLPDVNRLLGPLRALTAIDPVNYHLPGNIISRRLDASTITPEHHPFAWLLGDFSRVSMFNEEKVPDRDLDAAFLLIDETLVEEVESRLTGTYFREPLRIRGGAENISMLYLRAQIFRPFFPNRVPEFAP